jgi:hypothetical protein
MEIYINEAKEEINVIRFILPQQTLEQNIYESTRIYFQ